MKNHFERIIGSLEILSPLKKTGTFNPITAGMLLRAHRSKDPKKELDKLGSVIKVSKLFGTPFPKPDSSVNGPIGLGVSENNRIIGLYPEDCHVLIAGQTGTGKSTLLKMVFSQALILNGKHEMKNIPHEKIICWLFVKAQDMRSLLTVNRDILVVTFNEIKLNPLEPPPGMKPIEWGSVFADLWIQAFRLYEGSKGFLIEILNNLYRKYEQFGHYPSLFDLYYYVRALKFPTISRTSRYQESILNRLGGLIYGSLGPVFDCSRGHINALVNNHTIFEILYLTSEQQIFTTNYLITYLFNYKLINETALRHYIGMDDVNLIADASLEKRPDLGLPIIHHLVTTVRKTKLNIFACTQTPHQLGASIHSNTFAKIMLSLSNGKDIEFMQQSMGIKDPDQKTYCYKLKPREAIIKFSSRYQEPFLARIPEVEL